jgi:PhnB protein
MNSVRLDPYLFFRGNAREAMEFYKNVFGGELTVQTVDEAPDFPGKEQMKGLIMHAVLDGDVRLMASDGPNASPETKKVELSLSGDDETRLRKYWDDLSQGGEVRMPLEKAPWGDTFGGLTDKYGVDWMVNIAAAKE